jgi:beta-galactosidase
MVVWTGFDYLGEPTPYDESWPSEVLILELTICLGLPKDRFIYTDRWNTESTLHILPHWNWEGREGEITPFSFIRTTTVLNFFINGKRAWVYRKKTALPQNRYRLMWMDVKYEPGTVKWWL